MASSSRLFISLRLDILPKSLTLLPLLEELDGEFPLFLLNFFATLGEVDDLPPDDDDDDDAEE